MTQETENLHLYPKYGDEPNNVIRLMEDFGYEVVYNRPETDSDGDTYFDVLLSRDTDAPWYSAVASLQEDYRKFNYEVTKNEEKRPVPPTPYNKGIFFVLFLFGIIPAFIYVFVKGAQQGKYEVELQLYNSQIVPITIELRRAAEECRVKAAALVGR